MAETEGNSGEHPGRTTDVSVTPDSKFAHTDIKGRFNQYTSAYWVLAIPALTARYITRFFSKFFDLPSFNNGAVKRTYASLVGLGMTSLTLGYALLTYGDMKRIFSETVGWEFNKRPQDVGFRDLWNSKNDIVRQTMRNFRKYNFRRFLADSAFFNFLLPSVSKRIDNKIMNKNTGKPYSFDIYDSVDLGIGVTAGYLVTDVVFRKQTFFEQLQGFIDSKINHTDRMGEVINAGDLLSLYDRHAKDKDSHYTVSGRMDTQKWRDEQRLFGRMASLMNQTYGNMSNAEKAKFTVPMFIYLLGEGMIDTSQMERSLTYIEVANRYGMDAAKELAAKALHNGTERAYVEEHFPVTLPTADPATASPQEDQKGGYAAKFTAENRDPRRVPAAGSLTQAERVEQQAAENGGVTLSA